MRYTIVTMEINYWAVLLCGILSVGLQVIWYGPLFGRIWQKVTGGVRQNNPLRLGTQFLITLFQVWVLVFFIRGWGVHSVGLPPTYFENALWIWLAFVLPTIIGYCLLSLGATKNTWIQCALLAGHQFVNFFIFGLVLGAWR